VTIDAAGVSWVDRRDALDAVVDAAPGPGA